MKRWKHNHARARTHTHTHAHTAPQRDLHAEVLPLRLRHALGDAPFPPRRALVVVDGPQLRGQHEVDEARGVGAHVGVEPGRAQHLRRHAGLRRAVGLVLELQPQRRPLLVAPARVAHVGVDARRRPHLGPHALGRAVVGVVHLVRPVRPHPGRPPRSGNEGRAGAGQQQRVLEAGGLVQGVRVVLAAVDDALRGRARGEGGHGRHLEARLLDPPRDVEDIRVVVGARRLALHLGPRRHGRHARVPQGGLLAGGHKRALVERVHVVHLRLRPALALGCESRCLEVEAVLSARTVKTLANLYSIEDACLCAAINVI
mmetsp:Transcript_12908/g.35793  ORF Transcript_12908/g.35793 Transcript_12908/m.35793 type:complete len:315 (+) Transcript_12908:507-1451(+)